MPLCRFAQLIRDDDFSELAEFVNRYVGCNVASEAALRAIIPKSTTNMLAGGSCKGAAGCVSWSNGTWIMWLKNRIRFDYGWNAAEFDLTSVTLHVFFLSIPETPAMIARLWEDSPEEANDPARSKISGSLLAEIAPINKTARSVLPSN